MSEASAARADRPTVEPLAHVQLLDMVDKLKHEEAWRSGSRNAIALTRGELRIVVTAVKQGTKLQEHRARGPMTLEVLSGAVRVTAAGQTVRLGPHELLVLEAPIEHDLEALEESAFLLTLVEPA